KPALGPFAPSPRLVPIDEGHRGIRRQRLSLAIPAPCPAAGSFEPINRALCAAMLPPGPACRVPELLSPVSTRFDEGSIFRICDRRFGYLKWYGLDLVCPHLVVENKAIVRGRAHAPPAAWDVRIARPGPGTVTGGLAKRFGLRIAESLPHIG